MDHLLPCREQQTTPCALFPSPLLSLSFRSILCCFCSPPCDLLFIYINSYLFLFVYMFTYLLLLLFFTYIDIPSTFLISSFLSLCRDMTSSPLLQLLYCCSLVTLRQLPKPWALAVALFLLCLDLITNTSIRFRKRTMFSRSKQTISSPPPCILTLSQSICLSVHVCV